MASLVKCLCLFTVIEIRKYSREKLKSDNLDAFISQKLTQNHQLIIKSVGTLTVDNQSSNQLTVAALNTSNQHQITHIWMMISWSLCLSSFGLIYQQTDSWVSPCRPAFCLPSLLSFCFLHRSKHSLLSSSLPLFSSQSLLPSSPFFLHLSSPCHPAPTSSLSLCPHLTLLGLNRCRCPFGSGTAGAAAESRVPLPPLSTVRPLCLSVWETYLTNDIGPISPIFMASISLTSACSFFSALHLFLFSCRILPEGNHLTFILFRLPLRQNKVEITTPNMSAFSEKDSRAWMRGTGHLCSSQSNQMPRVNKDQEVESACLQLIGHRCSNSSLCASCR